MAPRTVLLLSAVLPIAAALQLQTCAGAAQCRSPSRAPAPRAVLSLPKFFKKKKKSTKAFDLAEYMDDLTESIFKADLRTSVNTYRQGLQLMYVEALIAALGEKSRLTGVAQSVVLAQLRRIDRQQRDASSPDGLTRAHRAHVRHLIDVALDR